MLLLAQLYLLEKRSLYLLEKAEIPASVLVTLQHGKAAEKLFSQSGRQLVQNRVCGCGGCSS